MPRPRICRKVWAHPHVTHFKPAGVPIVRLDESVLSIEELESLFDYQYYLRYMDEIFKRLGLTESQWKKKPSVMEPGELAPRGI